MRLVPPKRCGKVSKGVCIVGKCLIFAVFFTFHWENFGMFGMFGKVSSIFFCKTQKFAVEACLGRVFVLFFCFSFLILFSWIRSFVRAV